MQQDSIKEHSEFYKSYLKSPEWKARSKAFRKQVGHCQFPFCAEISWRTLEVHHTHYRNLGMECAEDILILCSVHHCCADVIRMIATGRSNEYIDNWLDRRMRSLWDEYLTIVSGYPTSALYWMNRIQSDLLKYSDDDGTMIAWFANMFDGYNEFDLPHCLNTILSKLIEWDWRTGRMRGGI